MPVQPIDNTLYYGIDFCKALLHGRYFLIQSLATPFFSNAIDFVTAFTRYSWIIIAIITGLVLLGVSQTTRICNIIAPPSSKHALEEALEQRSKLSATLQATEASMRINQSGFYGERRRQAHARPVG